MKHRILISCFVSFIVFSASAQDHKSDIKHTAEQLGDATVRKDYNAIADYTYPKFIEAVGGRDSLLAGIKHGFESLKSQRSNLSIESVTIGEPGDEVLIHSVLYSVVPEKLVFKINGLRYGAVSSLIAVSSDGGRTWTFLDTAGLDDLTKMFPDIKKLTIPPHTSLVRLKDN